MNQKRQIVFRIFSIALAFIALYFVGLWQGAKIIRAQGECVGFELVGCPGGSPCNCSDPVNYAHLSEAETGRRLDQYNPPWYVALCATRY